MTRQPTTIDREKLRTAIRKLGHQYVFSMLDDAIDILPPAKLEQLASQYLDVKSLRPDVNRQKTSLLEDVLKFDKVSRASEYYESFNVNSKNCTEQSTGTTAWMAAFLKLLDRCVTEAVKGKAADVCRTFNILFGLLDAIDECNDDIIFFADEGGAWQVSVDWDEVLPPWFIVLSATTAPDEYAERICKLLKHHYNYGSEKMLVVARKTATPEQRIALEAYIDKTNKTNDRRNL